VFQLRAIPLLIMLVAGLAMPGSAPAAPPLNDAFAAAEELSGRTATASGLNKEATKETNEPNHADNAGGASVWYRWTAPASGRAHLSTCGSGTDFDTLLAAYTGDSVNTLQHVQSNNDSCGTKSSMSVAVLEGVTYRIAIDGHNGATGGFTLELRLAPPNDDFADAVELTGDAGGVDGTNLGASSEADEPDYLGNSVWYQWTAPSSGWATFETCGGDLDSILAAFTGSELADLELIAWDDEGCSPSSRVSFQATAGVTYSVALYGWEGAEGDFHLAWNRNPPPPEPPFPVDYPSITGVAREGQTLTASDGEWVGATPISFAYAWVRCSPNFDSCSPIGDATARTHTLTGADVGFRLYVVVTASNVAGSSSEASDVTPTVRPSGPTNTAPPQVTGVARAGDSLFASAGTWTGIEPIQYAYQWQECNTAGHACFDLPGENSSVIELRAQHVDSRLRVVVTATNADGARSAVSGPSPVVAAAPRQPAARCVVPNVRGKTVARARRMLRSRRCALGKVTRAYSARVKPGRIIRQSRRPAARFPRGTRVHVVVSRGRRR
jgi:hypothetical protein